MGQFYLPSNSCSHNYLYYFDLGQHFIVSFLMLDSFMPLMRIPIIINTLMGIQLSPMSCPHCGGIFPNCTILIFWVLCTAHCELAYMFGAACLYFACIRLHVVLSGYLFPTSIMLMSGLFIPYFYTLLA